MRLEQATKATKPERGVREFKLCLMSQHWVGRMIPFPEFPDRRAMLSLDEDMAVSRLMLMLGTTLTPSFDLGLDDDMVE